MGEEVFSDSDDEDSHFLTKQTVSVTDYFLRKGASKVDSASEGEEDADARPSFAAPSHDLTDFCGIEHKRKRDSASEEEDVVPEVPALTKKEKREKRKKKERKEKKKKSKSSKKAKSTEEEESTKKSKKSSKKSKKEKKSKSSSEPDAKRERSPSHSA